MRYKGRGHDSGISTSHHKRSKGDGHRREPTPYRLQFDALDFTRAERMDSFQHRRLEEGIALGYRFCIHTAVSSALNSQYPALISVQMPHGMSQLEAMDNDVCDASIINEDSWRTQRFGSPEHCDNKVRLWGSVASIPNAYPVRPELEQVLSWALIKCVERGIYTRLATEAKTNYTDKLHICKEQLEFSTMAQLEFRQMGGAIILIAVVASLSVILTRLGIAGKKLESRLTCRTGRGQGDESIFKRIFPLPHSLCHYTLVSASLQVPVPVPVNKPPQQQNETHRTP